MTLVHEEKRAEDRFSLFVIATLHSQQGGGSVKIRNISRNGALLEGDGFPAPGSRVELRRGTMSVAGRIIWHRTDKAGIQFADPVDVGLWLPTASNQRQVDQAVETIKAAAGSTTLSPAPSAPLHASFISAQDMARTAALLDDLADALSNDAGVLFNYATKLQALDIAAQLLRKMAAQAERTEGMG